MDSQQSLGKANLGDNSVGPIGAFLVKKYPNQLLSNVSGHWQCCIRQPNKLHTISALLFVDSMLIYY
jgi:hypothetical protein